MSFESTECLQCFDAVGWAAERASSLQKIWSGEVLACLSRWLSGLMRFLSRSALLGLTGWRPAIPARVQSPGEAWVSLLVGLIVGML